MAGAPIRVDALGLVQPEARDLGGRVEEVGSGHEQALEHVGQVPHCELVVEVDGRLAERGRDLQHQAQRELHSDALDHVTSRVSGLGAAKPGSSCITAYDHTAMQRKTWSSILSCAFVMSLSIYTQLFSS